MHALEVAALFAAQGNEDDVGEGDEYGGGGDKLDVSILGEDCQLAMMMMWFL